MEGIIMKNIQERAREYADRHKAAEIVGKVYGYERIYNAELIAYERGATDQKAIEEAVTFTKSNAMTGKQLDREECFTSWYFLNAKGAPTFSDAIEWARKEMLDEVCDWLKAHIMFLSDELMDILLRNLRKSMEE